LRCVVAVYIALSLIGAAILLWMLAIYLYK